MDIDGVLTEVRQLWSTGHATEHSYRPALHALFASIDPALDVINEPKRSEGGMPDFLFARNAIAVGWAEAGQGRHPPEGVLRQTAQTI